MKKYLVLILLALGVYFAWRKFGGGVRSAITAVTK